MSPISGIIDYENGDLSAIETLELFASLIQNGTAWNLQGSYGRTAADLLELGYVTTDGKITDLGREFALEHGEG